MTTQMILETIKKECNKQDLSRGDLAKKLGVTPMTVCNIFKEKTGLKLDMAVKMADILGLEFFIADSKEIDEVYAWRDSQREREISKTIMGLQKELQEIKTRHER